MTKCELSIVLDEPDRVFEADDTIRGRVRVEANKNVRCNGLKVCRVWATHGRGNVAREAGQVETLFEGELSAGDQIEREFEFVAPAWPPTYSGHHFHIDHYVEATVDIPWAFDPKTKSRFILRASPDAATAAAPMSASSKVVATIACLAIALTAAGIAIMIGPIAIAVVSVVFLVLASLAVIFYVLPGRLLGDVTVQLPDVVEAGSMLRGEFVIDPKTSRRVGAVTMTLVGTEKTVSGSGSNATTHTHSIVNRMVEICNQLDLTAGKQKRIAIETEIESQLPPTVKLGVNTIFYQAKFEIDIARWPNWRTKRNLVIAPEAAQRHQASQPQRANRLGKAKLDGNDRVEIAPNEITFDETIKHIHEARHDEGTRGALVEAVTGMTFDFSAIIDRRLLYAGDDPHIGPDQYAVWAHSISPKVSLTLYVPHDLGDDLEQAGRDPWHGRGTLLGWDDRHDRLRILVDPASC